MFISKNDLNNIEKAITRLNTNVQKLKNESMFYRDRLIMVENKADCIHPFFVFVWTNEQYCMDGGVLTAFGVKKCDRCNKVLKHYKLESELREDEHNYKLKIATEQLKQAKDNLKNVQEGNDVH